ncbi:MAG: GntR family transcriptional regulator [Acidobacteria bacterium]|nr:GntR family transcriptional regulator [Acidobacteriota bacterium]
MFDHIDPRSPTPIYAQIVARVRIAVASGELATGDPLPSMRALAGTLRVNPATVVQAYRDLERDGVVDMRQGSGTFIATLSPEARGHTREQEARRLVRELRERAARLAICPLDLRRAIDAELGTRS